jgi:hypothetical protein
MLVNLLCIIHKLCITINSLIEYVIPIQYMYKNVFVVETGGLSMPVAKCLALTYLG